MTPLNLFYLWLFLTLVSTAWNEAMGVDHTYSFNSAIDFAVTLIYVSLLS